MILQQIKLNYTGKFVIVLLLTVGFSFSTSQAQRANQTNIFLADPAIYNENGIYYLYGTVGGNPNEGFKGYTSTNLKKWKKAENINNGYALKKGDVYGTANFWAPQIFVDHNIFYMTYVANENIAIATATTAAGPFTQNIPKQLDAPVRQIDPFIFIDDDGKKYLYHVRLINGNKIFVAQMKDDLSAIVPETLKECIIATHAWENTAHANWPVTEGPSILKHKGIYYLFYTANDFRNPDYAVGYATSNTPLGPWIKYAGNPILSKKTIGVNGTGHGDFVKDERDRLWYVFHTHFSDSVVAPRKTALIKMNFKADKLAGMDKVEPDVKSFYFLMTDKN